MPKPNLGSTAKERLTNMGKAAQKQRETRQKQEQERENELRQAVLQNTTSLLNRTGPSYQSQTPLAQLAAEQEAEREQVRLASQRANANLALSNRAQAENQIQSEAERQQGVVNLALNRMDTEDLASLRTRLAEQATGINPSTNPAEYNRVVNSGQTVQNVLDQRYSADYENAPLNWKIGQNIGYVGSRAGAGLLGALEGIADAGATMLADERYGRLLPSVGLAQGIAGLTGNDDVLQNAAEQALTISPTNDFRQSIEERYTPGTIARGVGELADTVTNMAPSIAANIVLPGAGLPLMAVQAGGSSAQEAYQSGADLEQAATYGTASGALEAGTEMLFGGLAGLGRGVLDTSVGNVVNQAIRRLGGTKAGQVVSGLAQNSLVRALADSAGEGVEEVISTALSPYLQRAIYDPDAENATAEELIQSALLGAAAGGVFQGIGAIARRAGVDAGSTTPRENTTMQLEDRGMLIPETRSSTVATEESGPMSQDTQQATTPQTAADGQNNTASTGETVISDYQRAEHHGNILDTVRANLSTVSAMRPVATITGQEFQKSSSDTRNLRTKVIEFFNSIGNKVTRKDLGDIELNTSGVRDSLSHGYGRLKSATFAALPQVLEQGELIAHNSPYEGHNYDSYIISAPVQVGNETVYVGALVIKDRKQRYKLHEVLTASESGAPLFQSEATSQDADGPLRNDTPLGASGDAPTDTSIPQIAQNVNPGGIRLPTADGNGMLPTADDLNLPGGESVSYDQAAQERAVRADDSTGAAPYGFDPYSNMLNEYGAIPEGENPARVVDVPVSTDGNDRVSRAARTVMEAEATPESMLGEVADAIVRGDLSHDVVTDKAATARARRTVENKGLEGALEEFHQAARSGKLSKNNVALGQVLLNNAMNAGDSQMAIDLLVDYASLATAAGQTLQAQRMLKKLTPEGQLYGIQRSVSNIQEELQQKYRDKAPDLEIPEELIENFRNATDQDGRDAAAEEIYKNIASQVPSTWMDKWNAWRYMAMLTNPRTHIRNIVGNLGFVPVRMVKDAVATTIEAGTDFVNQNILRRDGIQRTKAALNPLSRADRSLVQAAFSDVQNVQEQLLGSGKYADSATGKIEDYRTIFKFKPLEAVRKGNSNLMEVEDAWFSKTAYAGALAGYLKANGVTAQQMTDGTVNQETLDAGRTYAIEEAQKATYRDANALSDFISNLRYRGSNPVGRAMNTVVEGVLPFRRTPANILMRGVEYSPVGLVNGVKEAVWDVHRGNKTAAEAIDDISAGLTGTGLLALGAWLASTGLVTGGGSGDDEQDSQNDLTGQQNYALTIGDKNFTLDWLAPEALPFFVGVEAYNVMSDQSEGGVTLDNILSAFERITDPMLEMSMLQGVQDAIETVQYADSGTLLKVAANSVLSYFTQALPTLLGQIERTTENQRYTTFMDRTNGVPTDIQYTIGQALNKVPGVEFQQIPYIDAWGRTESSGNVFERAFNNFLNPSYSSKDQTTETDRELQRLYDAGQTGVFPDRTAQSQKVDGEYMTAEEYVQYATTKGQTSYDIVTDMINSDLYQGMTDEEKANAIKKAYQYAGHIAAQEVNPDHESDNYVANAANAQDTLGVSTGEYLLMYQEYGASKMDRLSELVQDGMNITEAEHLVGEKNYGASDIKEYNEFVSAGLSERDSESLVDALSGLKPENGSDSVSSLQKCRAVLNTVSGDENQMNALSQVMSESEYEKLSTGTEYGVSPNAYVTFKETVNQYDADGNGSLKQAEVEAALDSFGGGLTLPGDTRITLTNDQKAVLWQLQGKSWSAKNNPYNTAIGQRVYDALHGTEQEPLSITLPMA